MMAMTTSNSIRVNPLFLKALFREQNDCIDGLFARCAPVLQPLQINGRALFWGTGKRIVKIRFQRFEYSAIMPLPDFGVTVGERNSARAIVVSRRKIYPLGWIGKRIAEKITVINCPGRFVNKHPAIGCPGSQDLSLLSVNQGYATARGVLPTGFIKAFMDMLRTVGVLRSGATLLISRTLVNLYVF